MQQADTSVSKRAHTTASWSPSPVDKTRKPSKTALHPLAPPKIPESMAARAPHPFLHGSGSFSCSCAASSLTAVQISTHAGLSAHSAPLLSPVIRSRPAAEPSKTLFGPIHRLCTAFGLLLMRSPTERQSGRKSVKQEASGEHRRRHPRPPRLHRLPCHPTTPMADDRQETGDGRRETGDRKWLTTDGRRLTGKTTQNSFPVSFGRTTRPTGRRHGKSTKKSEAASSQGDSLATQIPSSDGSGITPRERPRRGPC